MYQDNYHDGAAEAIKDNQNLAYQMHEDYMENKTPTVRECLIDSENIYKAGGLAKSHMLDNMKPVDLYDLSPSPLSHIQCDPLDSLLAKPIDSDYLKLVDLSPSPLSHIPYKPLSETNNWDLY